MTTPEGRVKNAVKKSLEAYNVRPFHDVAKHPQGAEGMYYMAVAGPYSVHGVHDFVGCWRGVFFSIETKSPDNPEDETAHQGNFRAAVTTSGGIALTGVRDGPSAVRRIATFVEEFHHGKEQRSQTGLPEGLQRPA